MKRQNVSALLSASLMGIALLMFSASAEAQGGLSIDVQSSHDNTSASTINSTSAFSTNAANELLLAFVASDYAHTGPNVTVTNVAGGGLTWQLVERTNFQFGTAEIWRAFAVSQLSNVSVTATLSQTVYSSISVVSFIGADRSGSNGSGAIGAVGSSEASTGAPSVSLVTTRNNSWVFGVGVDYDGAINRTPGSSQSLVHQFLSPSNDTYWVQQQTATTTQAGTTVLINDTAPIGDRSDMSSVEILPAPASGSSGLGIDVQVSSDVQTAGSTNSTPAFSTASSNELLLAFVSADRLVDPNTTVTGISGAGLTWELVQRTNAQLGDAEIWRAFAPTPLSNVTVTATLSQAVVSSMTVISFIGADPSGINGSGAIGATATGSSSPGAPSAPLASLTTTRDGSWVFAMGDDFDNSIPRVVGSSQTLRHEYFPPVNDTYWVQSQIGPTPHSGTVVTINDASPSTDRFNLSLVEVLPTQASGGPSITSVSPSIAAVGSAVTITGINFAATQSSGTVTFGGVAANVNSWSATSIVASVPTALSAGLEPVIVTVAGTGASNAESFTVDAPPTVNAGPSLTIQLPVNTVTLDGTASDDGIPNGSLSVAWTEVSGPGMVSFSDSESGVTNATFTAAGTYDLRLTANDSALQSSSDTTVTVLDVGPDQPPVVNAGSNQTISSIPGQANLNGSVVDDGFPVGGHVVSQWTMLSGPGTVTFSNPTTPGTSATFSAPGVYVLALSANDGEFTGTGDVTITVTDSNKAPVVNAGPNQTITWPTNSATLNGSATDDGVPSGSLALAWSQVSGAGTATFANPNAAITNVTFSKPGTYILRLSANDSQLTSTADVLVFVGHLSCARSNKGSDFWLTFMAAGIGTTGPEVPTLYLTGDRATSGLVTISGLNFTAPFSVTPNQVTTVNLPVGVDLGASSDALANLGIHVSAQDEITVYGVNLKQFVADGFTALPVPSLGTDYVAMSYRNGSLQGSEFAFVATADNTHVTVTPAATAGNRPGGVAYTVVLSQGQTYQLQKMTTPQTSGQIADTDLTGSFIHSDNPIAFFSGHQCSFVPQNTGTCNWLVEQIPPVDTWGSHFVTMPLAGRIIGDLFRFLAASDNTHVAINGTVVATLSRGAFYEQILKQPSEISSDNPILVAQFSQSQQAGGGPNGGGDADPFMALVVPYDQFGGKATIMSAPATNFDAHFLNIVAPSNGKGSLILDGEPIPAASFSDIGSSGFSGAQFAVAPGSHTITGSVPFGTLAYGFGQADAYGYNGSMCLATTKSNTTIALTPTTSTAPVGSQACVSATVTDAGGAPLAGADVDFKLSGVTQAATSLMADANGQVQFCYVGKSTGSDSITGTAGDISGTAAVNWTSNGPNQPPVVNAGSNQSIVLPIATVTLNGSVFDDGLPTGSTLATAWTEISGPAAVSFSNPNQAITNATFNTPGTYVLQLSANDTQYTTNSTVTITVGGPDQPPVVTVNVDSSTPPVANSCVLLDQNVTYSGSGTLTSAWTVFSGPTLVHFSTFNATQTCANFTQLGTYVLALAVNDGLLTVTTPLTVSVTTGAGLPSINAGPTQTIFLPNAANLQGIVFSGVTPMTFQWSVSSGPGPVTFSAPNSLATQATFTVAGSYQLQLTATNQAGHSSALESITVNQPTAPAPTVSITSPDPDTDVTKPIVFAGTLSGQTGTTYVLQYSPVAADGSTTQWKTFASGSAPMSGTLGTFDPTLLLNGIYAVQLTATDPQAQSTSTAITVEVRGNMKIGVFNVSFNDLTIPMPGLSIQIIRTYDSRMKTAGDFGVGWSLGINGPQLRKNGKLGQGWNETAQYNFFPTYCLQPTKNHIVTITMPDGKQYRFQASAQCQNDAPIEVANLTFQQLPTGASTTGASLSIAGDPQAIVNGDVPGVVSFIDNNADTYDSTLFQLTTAEGFVYLIDQKAGVQSVRDLNGNTLTITANGIIHSSGKSVVFRRDPQGRITQITDPNGNVLNYSFTDGGDLEYFADAAGNQTAYQYDGQHNLTSIQPPVNGGRAAVTNTYNTSGQLATTKDSLLNPTTFTHNVSGQTETVTDALNHATIYTYDDDGNVLSATDPLGNVTSATYDLNDNKLTETNGLGKTTTYTYDDFGNRLTESDPLGHTTTYTYNQRKQPLTIKDPNGNVTTNTYDGNGNLLSTQDALGKTTTYTYTPSGLPATVKDAQQHVTKFQYDGNGNLTSQTDALLTVTSYTYDGNGNKLTQAVTRTLADGSKQTLTTHYVYDAANRLTKTIAADGSTTQTQYDALGRRSATIDALNRTTSYTLDDDGRVTKTTYPDTTFEQTTYDNADHRTNFIDRASHNFLYTYDAAGRLTTTTAPNGPTTTGYDAAGQVTSTKDADNNVTQYVYDGAGRRTQVIDALNHTTIFGYDNAGNQTSVTDANQHVTTYVYDQDNRRTQTIYHDQTSETIGSDELGRMTSKTDQAGKVTNYGYDPLGRLTSVTQFLNGNPLVTSYGYDEVGNRISQTDANNHTTSYTYDQLGRRLSRTLPLGQTESYSYDAAGNLQSKTDFNGHTTTYAYDSMNRLLSKTADPFFSSGACANGACGATQVGFTYNNLGQRATMTDATGKTTYGYDGAARLISVATPLGTLSYNYDKQNNQTTTSWSGSGSGGFSTYTYDALNRLLTVNDTNTVAATASYAYDPVGNLSSVTYGNNVVHSYTYDALNRLTNLSLLCGTVTPNCGPGGATQAASYAYTLGPAGNRTGVTELSGRTVTYGYDDLYRLTSETISNATSQTGTIGYTYDAVGNRKQITSTVNAIPTSGTLLYDANDRTATDTYDNNGNTGAQAGITNVYDFENHLVQHGAITITYDGDGNRVAETVGGVTTKYLVDSNTLTGYAQVRSEFQNGTRVRAYMYGLERLAEVQTVNNVANTVSYYGYDGHGSVRDLISTIGTVTDTYNYDAFGNLLASTGSTPNNYLFAGEQFDPNLGLYYNRARYLDVTAGRFWGMDTLESDPQSPGSLHRYLYSDNDPINRVDPSGNESVLSISISFAVNQTLEALPYSVAFRAGQFAYRAIKGQDIGAAAEDAALGILEDSASVFLSAGLLKYAVATLPLREAGGTLIRAAGSIWSLANGPRGKAVEDFIFQNVLGRARYLHPNFPVIDDFFQGIATSIKSMDLTAARYATEAGIRSALSDSASALSEFAGKRFAGVALNTSQITERVLIVGIEDGAATVEQELALKAFLRDYKTIWPNIKIVLQIIK